MINSDELLFVVDEDNNPLTPKPRKEVHRKGYWHRTAHIWILNDQKQILCQKRSILKDSSPGKWEPFFGGHMAPGEDYTENALIELEEELGIKSAKEDLHLYTIFKCESSTEYQGVHYLIWNGDITSLHLEKDEIDHVEWMTLDDLYTKIVVNKDPDWSIMGYEKELIEYFKEVNTVQ